MKELKKECQKLLSDAKYAEYVRDVFRELETALQGAKDRGLEVTWHPNRAPQGSLTNFFSVTIKKKLY